jgi:hypothetical protein
MDSNNGKRNPARPNLRQTRKRKSVTRTRS